MDGSWVIFYRKPFHNRDMVYRVGVDELLRVLLCVEGITRVLFIFSDSSLLALWYQTDFKIFKFLNKIIGTLSFEGV